LIINDPFSRKAVSTQTDTPSTIATFAFVSPETAQVDILRFKASDSEARVDIEHQLCAKLLSDIDLAAAQLPFEEGGLIGDL